MDERRCEEFVEAVIQGMTRSLDNLKNGRATPQDLTQAEAGHSSATSGLYTIIYRVPGNERDALYVGKDCKCSIVEGNVPVHPKLTIPI